MKVYYLLLLFSTILCVTSETSMKESSSRINDLYHIFTQNMKTVLIQGKIKDFSCGTCSVIVDSIIDLRNKNSSSADILALSEFLCNRGAVEALTPKACLSLIKLNMHQVLYVIDNFPPNVAKQMCGIVYQDEKCGFKPIFWKVSINGGFNNNTETIDMAPGTCKCGLVGQSRQNCVKCSSLCQIVCIQKINNFNKYGYGSICCEETNPSQLLPPDETGVPEEVNVIPTYEEQPISFKEEKARLRELPPAKPDETSDQVEEVNAIPMEEDQQVNFLKEGDTLSNRGGKPLNILHLTDIHYDPQYTPGSNRNCKYCICCGRDDDNITSFEDKAGYWGDYIRCDVPLYMIEDLFNQLSRRSEEFDIIYFTGDIVSHRMWNTSIESNTRDIRLIMQLFRKYFPNKPIFPILGNHESSPLNLYVPLSSGNTPFSTQWLFDLVAEEWGTWLPEETKETIRMGGYYKTNTKEGLCIIGLNSNPANPFNYWLTVDDVDPYRQLQWLANTLEYAERRGETCHILTHLPPLNAHVPWASEYRRIIERYSHVVMGQFCGHTHLVELNIFYTADAPQRPINVAWNGGSITTYRGVNPNYRIFQSDPGNFELLDYDEYIMDVKMANQVVEAPTTWYKLYSFKREYNVESLSPEDISKLVDRMIQNATLRLIYNKNKMRGSGIIVCDRKCEVKALRNMVTSVYSDTTMADYVEANMN